ncbi:MAG: NADH:ubiquinone reductase (Na(+)-transporting) subunit E [Bacteroidetes bacterium]|jgi:Na+-transporting NADH:ubiquinone oxidoreductase subunit E|nr:NADH:ubiquinone reductase (Na(+)-transporting) subunit E [Bacteroidota bacterium]
MESIISIFVKSVFVDNMIFAYFLGMCTYIAISKEVKAAFSLGIAVILALTITVPLNWVLYHYFLAEGALAWTGIKALATVDLSFLGLITYISIIAAFIQMLEMIIEKYYPSLYNTLGIFLPLLAVNCAILAGSLFMVGRPYNLAEATAYGAGSGFGWFLAITSLAALREKIKYSNVPAPLRGVGITFILIGLMAFGYLSFIGFTI